MVAHPDRPLHNGFMAYTNETRGALNKLVPTCKQPSANEVARAQAFQKKQQAIYDANVQSIVTISGNAQIEASMVVNELTISGTHELAGSRYPLTASCVLHGQLTARRI